MAKLENGRAAFEHRFGRGEAGKSAAFQRGSVEDGIYARECSMKSRTNLARRSCCSIRPGCLHIVTPGR